METIFDWFDKTYIINLKNREDRRRETADEFKSAGIPFPHPKVEFFEACRPADKGPYPNLGARGGFYSHMNVMKKALAEGHEKVLVLEDDLSFSDLFMKVQPELIRQLQEGDWQIAYLGHPLKDIAPPSGAPVSLECYEKPILLAHFIAYKADALRTISEFMEAADGREPGDPAGGPMYPDGAISMARMQHPELKTVAVSPNLGFQRPSPSDIAGWKWFDRIPPLHWLINQLRRFKHRKMR